MNNQLPLTWYGHSSWRIDAPGIVVYIDPWKIPAGQPPADLVLVTHEHTDHCSPTDIKKISTPNTKIIAAISTKELLSDHQCRYVRSGEWISVSGVKLSTVPAYNINKPFHPNDGTRTGFIATINGVRYYHAGDTDHIPDMARFIVDVALLPIDGVYTMTADEAAAAARELKPHIAIPMHFGDIVGKLADAERFKSLLEPDIAVSIFQPTK